MDTRISQSMTFKCHMMAYCENFKYYTKRLNSGGRINCMCYASKHFDY